MPYLVVLALAAPLLALASTSGLDSALAAVTVREWIGLVIISTIGGVGSLLWRLAASQEARFARAEQRQFRETDIVRVSMPLFVASHMTGAWIAGGTAFFAAQAQVGVGVSNGHAIALALLTASVSGAQFAERGLGKLRAAREAGKT